MHKGHVDDLKRTAVAMIGPDSPWWSSPPSPAPRSAWGPRRWSWSRQCWWSHRSSRACQSHAGCTAMPRWSFQHPVNSYHAQKALATHWCWHHTKQMFIKVAPKYKKKVGGGETVVCTCTWVLVTSSASSEKCHRVKLSSISHKQLRRLQSQTFISTHNCITMS